jgi:hypothetical protein
MRKKMTAPESVTEDMIHAKYAAIDWRFPFSEPLTSVYSCFLYYVVNSFDPRKYPRARNPDHLVSLVERDMICIAILLGTFKLLFYLLLAPLLARRIWRAIPSVGRRAPKHSWSPPAKVMDNNGYSIRDAIGVSKRGRAPSMQPENVSDGRSSVDSMANVKIAMRRSSSVGKIL